MNIKVKDLPNVRYHIFGGTLDAIKVKDCQQEHSSSILKSFQRFCLTLFVSTNNLKYLIFFKTSMSQSTSFYIT
ncbi:hypothetical protein Taro_013484 [Colocasia esculenta]|uniref:Uncharacterized protein n=1 Tax=Colocasia esculenta TaxID=4460 RepID=A0A843UBY2_COLES|nr:hypothetical protein [Colocasia esculenta]